MFKTRQIGGGSGLKVYARVQVRTGSIKWLLVDMVGCDVVAECFSHVDAATWIVRLESTSWEDAIARVDETVLWANRIAADIDVLLQHAPASSIITDVDGQ